MGCVSAEQVLSEEASWAACGKQGLKWHHPRLLCSGSDFPRWWAVIQSVSHMNPSLLSLCITSHSVYYSNTRKLGQRLSGRDCVTCGRAKHWKRQKRTCKYMHSHRERQRGRESFMNVETWKSVFQDVNVTSLYFWLFHVHRMLDWSHDQVRMHLDLW